VYSISRLLAFNRRYLGSSWMDFDEDSVLESSSVVDYMIKIFGILLPNLVLKLKLAEIWKSKNGFS
jgi:hypothetical protein